jgi:hypothetical protein
MCRIFAPGLRKVSRIGILVPADHPRLNTYFCFLEHLLNRSLMPLRHIVIRTINGEPAPRQTAYVAVLAELFETIVDHLAVTLYRRH